VDPSRLVAGAKCVVGEDKYGYYGDPVPVPKERIGTFTGGEELVSGGHMVNIYHAPGHIPLSSCLIA